MINLRYHIVSIVAVFLALGIGTALGGTFLNRYTVDLLEQSISSAEDRISATNAENSDLEGTVSEAQARERALLEQAGEELLDGHLTDVPVLLITAPGVTGDDTEDLRLSLLDAGADYRGALELRDALALEGDIDDRLAEAVDVDPGVPGLVRTEVVEQFQAALLDAGAPPTDPTDPDPFAPSTTTTPDTTTPPVTEPGAPSTTTPDRDPGTPIDPGAPDGTTPTLVTAMLGADLVRFTPGPGHSEDDPILAQTGHRYVLVGRPGLDASANSLLLQLLPADPDTGAAPAVIVSPTTPTDTEDPEPTAVEIVRSNPDLVDRYSTVDNIDHLAGLVSTVLALEDLADGVTGHYGEADGAASIVPPRP